MTNTMTRLAGSMTTIDVGTFSLREAAQAVQRIGSRATPSFARHFGWHEGSTWLTQGVLAYRNLRVDEDAGKLEVSVVGSTLVHGRVQHAATISGPKVDEFIAAFKRACREGLMHPEERYSRAAALLRALGRDMGADPAAFTVTGASGKFTQTCDASFDSRWQGNWA